VRNPADTAAGTIEKIEDVTPMVFGANAARLFGRAASNAAGDPVL
jgi:hypothetical protein